MTIMDSDRGFGEASERPKSELSLLALAAFIIAILACIPVLPPIGVVLGMIALVRLMGEPQLRGRGLAIAAIVLGLCFSIGWGVGGYFLVRQARVVKQFIESAPNDALTAGMAGDVNTFRAAFSTDHPPDTAQAFLDELRARYGDFQGLVATGATGAQPDASNSERAVVPFSYVATFSSGDVNVEVDLLFATSTGGFGLSIEAMSIRDRARPALRYPPSPPPPTASTIPRPTDATDAADPAEPADP